MDEFNVEHSLRRCGHSDEVTSQGWALVRKYTLVFALVFACPSALAQAMYRITPLGLLDNCTSYVPGAGGFNEADEVAGAACNAQGAVHAFLWKNNGTPMEDLGPPEGGSISAAKTLNASGIAAGYAHDSTGWFTFESSGNGAAMTRIYNGLGGSAIYPNAENDAGQLTGVASTFGDGFGHAFLWRNDGSPMLDLGTVSYRESEGYAINAFGQIAGYADFPGNVSGHAFVWKNDGTPMLDLGTLGGNLSVATLINASGQVAGASDVLATKAAAHAFFWRNDGTPMKDLGTLGGAQSYAEALNDSGQIAGYSQTRRNRNPHAFVWMNDGTPMKDLGTLGGTKSAAYDMNASGQVTGRAYLAGNAIWHAFLWRNDGTKIQDLNKLIDPTDPLNAYITLINGEFINDLGDIVADGTDSRTGLQGLYLLQGTVLTLSPRSLAFGNQPINTSSAAKSVTVTNTSAKVVAITSIALTGSASGQFASTYNCGSSLSGHATCTIKVTFKPTKSGAKSATLIVNGGGGGLRAAKLTGTGR